MLAFGQRSLVEILEWSGLHTRPGGGRFERTFEITVVILVQAANGQLRCALEKSSQRASLPGLGSLWSSEHGTLRKELPPNFQRQAMPFSIDGPSSREMESRKRKCNPLICGPYRRRSGEFANEDS